MKRAVRRTEIHRSHDGSGRLQARPARLAAARSTRGCARRSMPAHAQDHDRRIAELKRLRRDNATAAFSAILIASAAAELDPGQC